MRKLSPIEQLIIELANIQPIVNKKLFAEYSKISYNTIRHYIPKLIKDNYLISTADGIVFNKNSDYKPLFRDYNELENKLNKLLTYTNALERELLERNLVTQEQLNQLRITLNIS